MLSRARILFLLATFLGFGLSGGSPVSLPGASLSVTSPDRPRTWFLGGDFEKLSQSLRWDQNTQTLSLDVTYTLHGEWPNPENSDLSKTFQLYFPQVKMSKLGRRLFLVLPGRSPIRVAMVQHGFVGDRVVLDPNVEVDAHRRNGVLIASLLVRGSD